MDAEYWNNRYAEKNTGWDLNGPSPALMNYFSKQAKNIKILIPGCGNAHEAATLYNNGFNNVYICDWASIPLENFANKYPNFPREQILNANFFELEQSGFDIVLEQTFFCALTPSLREEYVSKVHSLLRNKGKLVGLLFNKEFDKKGPPFGGTKEQYAKMFGNIFQSISLTICYNSIPPRAGNELFIIAQKNQSI